MNSHLKEVNFDGMCKYYDLSNANDPCCNNTILHINIRSLFNKVAQIESLLTLLKYPKFFFMSEVWLNASDDVKFVNIPNYSFVS